MRCVCRCLAVDIAWATPHPSALAWQSCKRVSPCLRCVVASLFNRLPGDKLLVCASRSQFQNKPSFFSHLRLYGSRHIYFGADSVAVTAAFSTLRTESSPPLGPLDARITGMSPSAGTGAYPRTERLSLRTAAVYHHACLPVFVRSLFVFARSSHDSSKVAKLSSYFSPFFVSFV